MLLSSSTYRLLLLLQLQLLLLPLPCGAAGEGAGVRKQREAVHYPIPFVHCIGEGHMGAYWRMHTLNPSVEAVSRTGCYTHNPFMTTRILSIKVTEDDDTMVAVPCNAMHNSAVTLDVTIFNSVNPTKQCIHKLMQDYQPDSTSTYDEKLLYKFVAKTMRQLCPTHTLESILTTAIPEMNQALQTALTAHLKKRGIDDCVLIRDVSIENPRVDPDVSRKMNDVTVQRQETLLQQQKAKTAKMEAESAEKARAIADAMEFATRKSKADAARYESDSKADAARYASTQQADSTRVLIESYGGAANYLTAEAIRTDGASDSHTTRVYMRPGDTVANTVYGLENILASTTKAQPEQQQPTDGTEPTCPSPP